MNIKTEEYIKGLSKLEMLENELYSSGLIHVNDLEGICSNINYHQRLHLEKAKRVKADAVYFRNYPNNSRPSIPQLYIFDFTTKEGDIVEIHKNVWSTSEVRLYVVINKTEIKLFNASKPVQKSEKKDFEVFPFETLNLAKDALDQFKKYSAKKFDNGTFWEETPIDFGYSTTSYEKLISELKNARTSFLNDIKLDKPVANKLLVLGILIKYLEERVDVDSNGNETRVFNSDFFYRKEFGYSKSFNEVIRNGFLINLFDYLSKHFNGKVFYLTDEYKKLLRDVDLTPLANFLSGDIEGKQYVLWRLYSFNHLPIELISSVYEMFLEADINKGVAYTPSYLVNFMIDECMPVHSPKSDFKILDPSCGSGIFLVSAYKRLIDWWRVEKHKSTGKWIKPEKEHLEELKKLLKDSVYGVDVAGEAVDLTTFSLSLALCDMLSPKVIWENLQFDDLSNNIVCSDFFKWFSEDKKETFDIVIGNPPFVEYGSKEKLINSLSRNIEVAVPQNQSSLWFTLQGIKLAKKDSGLLAFVLPSGPLLYNNSQKPIAFRSWLFSNFNIPQIIDFTYLSNVLFKNKGNEKNVAVSAIFIENKQPDKEPIYHITVKRLKSAKERQYFEIDHYDFHKVGKESALNDAFVWKANLLGGGRLPTFIRKLSKLQTLQDYLILKEQTAGWHYGEGFIVGNIKNHDTEEIVFNKPNLPTSSFTEAGIVFNDIEVHFKQEHFEAKRKSKIYSPPLLLIKERLGKKTIPVELVNQYLTYRHDIIGIHSPITDRDDLINMRNRIFENQLYRFYLITTSGRAGVSRSSFTVLKGDIMSLPYPDDSSEIELSEYEQILLDDTLNYGIELLGKETSVMSLLPAKEPEIGAFGDVFTKVLNSLFEENGRKYHLENIYETETFIGVSFYYSSEYNSKPRVYADEKAEASLASLIHNTLGTNYRINRIVKFYDGDRIYLLKPKQLRYWLKSVALRDADETIVDLYNAGY